MSAIKFRKRLTKFKITIALPKKFGSKGFIKPNQPNNVMQFCLNQYIGSGVQKVLYLKFDMVCCLENEAKDMKI